MNETKPVCYVVTWHRASYRIILLFITPPLSIGSALVSSLLFLNTLSQNSLCRSEHGSIHRSQHHNQFLFSTPPRTTLSPFIESLFLFHPLTVLRSVHFIPEHCHTPSLFVVFPTTSLHSPSLSKFPPSLFLPIVPTLLLPYLTTKKANLLLPCFPRRRA